MKECPACRRCFPDDINHCPQDGDATLPSLLGDPILDARYQLERRLGQGGMGVVFQARHIFLKTQHAIKVILPDLVGNDPMLVTRFRQEALAAAAIKHQNIIAVTDFGVVRGTMPFLVMEFVNGRSLQEIMAEEGAMPAGRAFELICAIASGVAAAHRQNIVHRDLKPLNIMVCENMPVADGLRILDFGLAKIRSGELLGSFVQAKTSGLMGSPFYMAPEQWSDEEPDSRADIYSLGIILYQMLGGDVPFKGSSIPSIMKKHLTELPPPLKSMGVDVPPQIEAVVRHALEKEVGGRTPSVEIFLKELRDAVTTVGAELRTTSEGPVIRDAHATLLSPHPNAGPTGAFPTKGQQTHATGFETKYDGASGAVVDDEQLRQLTITNEAIARDEAAKEQFARDTLAREAEHRKRRLSEDDARSRREREERDEQERRHKEQLDRVARAAEELEQKLSRLATSMAPNSSAVIDPEATQVQQRTAPAQTIGEPTAFTGGATTQQTTGMTTQGTVVRKKSPLVLVAIALVLIVLAGVGVGGYFIFRSKPGVETPPNTNKGKTGNDGPTGTDLTKIDMVEIPGGEFQMGRDNGPLQEQPAHPMKVDSFLMGQTEVTNAAYAEFVRETNHAAPIHWNGTKAPISQENWPVVNVNFEDVSAFIKWRSQRDQKNYRLPTEAEWEYAARNGQQDDLYPWGKEWKDNMAVLDEQLAGPVNSHPQGNNKWGVSDLIGNVWEWTSSKVSAYPGNKTVIPTSTQDWITIRGGGFITKTNDKDNPVSSCMRSFISPAQKNTLLGFRLVRSAN